MSQQYSIDNSIVHWLCVRDLANRNSPSVFFSMEPSRNKVHVGAGRQLSFPMPSGSRSRLMVGERAMWIMDLEFCLCFLCWLEFVVCGGEVTS